jgi:hypothetical protein
MNERNILEVTLGLLSSYLKSNCHIYSKIFSQYHYIMPYSLLTSGEILKSCVGNLVLWQAELNILALEFIAENPNMLTLQEPC